VLQYQNTEKPIREIAGELGIDAVIEASVFRAADSVEFEVRLVDGRTEQIVVDPIVRSGEVRNVVALYRDLTGAIAAEIQAALSPQVQARLASAREVNPEAYDAYLRGQFHWYKLTPADLEIALQYYDRALEIDPDYAPAYAGIALAWVGRSQMGMARPRDAIPQMVAAAEKAVALDSTRKGVPPGHRAQSQLSGCASRILTLPAYCGAPERGDATDGASS
jgi:tetratricopeptide (TPR) repeat protein